MKTHKTLCLALIVSAVPAVSVQADNHNGNNSGSHFAPARGRSSAPSFSSGSGYRYSGRMIGSSQRFSAMGVRSMPTSFRQRSFGSGGNVASFNRGQFTPGAFNNRAGFASSRTGVASSGNGFANNRTGNLATNRGNGVNRLNSFNNNNRFNNNRLNNHVFARHSADWHRDWDHDHDHFWRGHRCRFVNGSWFIFDLGFFPWYGFPYDYGYPYPYGGYGYDPGYGYGYDPRYDQGYDSNYSDQGVDPNYNNQGGYNSSSEESVAAAQDRLAQAGYYHGRIDGVSGPETRRALLRYQADHGLGATGYLTMETRQSLGIRQGAAY